MSNFFENMAYNIYSDPDLSKTSKAFDSFVIDFRGARTPILTYWALCNFGLYFSEETKAQFPGIAGGGAYAGLQRLENWKGRRAIMAFWEMTYGEDKTIMRATRVYPKGEESNFGGEGEGTNCILPYEWETGTWYRMALHAWEDSVTGKTFVGQWVCNLETGKWDLISYFNTRLTKSALRGGMSLFQENFIGGVNQFVEREFHVKNTYVLDHMDKEWKSLNASYLCYSDGGADNKSGLHYFGATKEYFWGVGGGAIAEKDQKAYNEASVKRARFEIEQPAQPTLGEIAIASFEIKDGKATWALTETSNPQLSYKLTCYEANGEILGESYVTRPEVREATVLPCARYTLTVTDIFGNTATAEIK